MRLTPESPAITIELGTAADEVNDNKDVGVDDLNVS